MSLLVIAVTILFFHVSGPAGYLLPFLGVGIESLGIPVPGETSLVIAAVLAAQGELSPVGVAVAGFLGAVLGDNAGYWIGRRWGTRLAALPAVGRLYTPARLQQAERFFARGGGFASVFFARFVAVLRILGGPLAGMHQMPWPRFLLANALGAAVWVGVIVTIGLLVGHNLHRAVALVSQLGVWGLVLAAIAIAGASLVWWWRHHRSAPDR
ncbi:MAG TPA: DedA family protein [Candidatus Dormibacteraeota bacterium]|nr:DedA family protein [Candidatus Dormibacteraeota bacterium]